MIELNKTDIECIAAGYNEADLGYDVGFAIGYVLGGGAGHDLGAWLYEKLN